MVDDVKWKFEGDATKINLSFTDLTGQEFFDTMCDLIKTVGLQQKVSVDISFEMRKNLTSEKDKTNV